MRGMRGERLSVREEGSGGGSELRSRFRSEIFSTDPDPEKRSGYFGYGCATLLANMRIFVS